MKKILLPLFLGLINLPSSFCQDVAPANVYPSNLEENMYFEKYDDATKKISGVNFLVLSDGDNSQKVTPAFTIKLYLMPEGKSSINDLVIVKTYELPGLYQMGSKEYKNEVVDLSKVSVASGRYRLGIWVNADKSFNEDDADNATLFKGVIAFTPNSNQTNNSSVIDDTKSSATEGKEEIQSEADDLSGGFNANFKRNKKETEGKSNQVHQQTKQVKTEEKANKQEVKEEVKEVKQEAKEEIKTETKTTTSTSDKKVEVVNKNTKPATSTKTNTKTTTSKSTSKPTVTKKK